MSATATTDITTSVDFLQRRFRGVHTGYAVLGFIKNGVTTHEYISLQAPDRWERAAHIIARYIDTHDCYVAAAVFKETKRWNPTTGKNEYRTTDMIAFVPVLYTDRDDNPYPETLPPPSYTVETSTGSFQDYYTLDTAIDADTAGRYLRQLAAALGLGNQAVDAARLLRFPGTINHKPERAGETVRVVTDGDAIYSLRDFDFLPEVESQSSNGTGPHAPLEFNPDFDAEGAAILERLRPLAPGEHPRRTALTERIWKIAHGDDAILKPTKDGLVPYEGESERRYAVVCALYDVGLNDDEVRAAFKATARWQRCVADHGEKDAERRLTTQDMPNAKGFIMQQREEAAEKKDRVPIPLRPNRVDPETGEVLESRALTDYGNAERLVQYHGGDLRFCHPFGNWLAWDGERWLIDNTAEVMRRAKQTARRVYQEAADATDPAQAKELAKHAIRSEGDARLRAMINLAESEPGVPVLPDQLDANPWLFNVENGTIDLKTGTLRPHNRADLITKIAPVTHDPSATCPTFDAFLARILPSESLRKFVQRAIGHSLTGDTREDVIFIPFGTGNNGKTTFMKTTQALLGDFAMQTPTETLMVKRGEGIPNDVARLKGARLVAASEAEEGKRLAESLIKQLTGRDKISARFMRAEWFDFDPTFKIWLSTNHKPIIRGTDLGIWRRIRLIPFAVTILAGERDETLPEKLLAELPGILNWSLAGCRDWLQHGLGMPEEVQQATGSYRAEMDLLGNWIGDCCVEGVNHQATAAELYASYKKWCEDNGIRGVMAQYTLGSRLSERGFEMKRGHGGKRYWRGIGLLSPDGTEPPDQPDLKSDEPGDAGDAGDANSSMNEIKYFSRGVILETASPASPASPAEEREEFEV